MKLYQQLNTQRDAVTQSWERLNENINRDWDLYGHDFGIHRINMAIGGIVPTRITTIGARSGSGKTSLLCPMFEASLRQKSNLSRVEYLLFSWELDPSIVIDRAICSRVGLTLRQLNQGAKLLSQETMHRVKGAYSVVSKFPVVYQTHSIDINHIKRIAKEFVDVCKEKSVIAGYHIQPVICIDYLNMAQFEAAGLRTYGIADFMNGLKQFCNETRAAAVVFAQLSRDTDKANKIPDRADFSDSAAIENASDNLIVMWRPEYHNINKVFDPDLGEDVESRGKALVRVLKGRDYGTGDFLINCDMKHFRFWDQAHSFDEAYFDKYKDPDFWMQEFKTNVQQLNLM